MRVTLKTVNDELARLGYTARLAKSSKYFYFQFGEAAEWLDRTVDATTVGSRTLEEWIGEFHRLEKLNAEILGKPEAKAEPTPAAKAAPKKRKSKSPE
jgi:hypothetical protein